MPTPPPVRPKTPPASGSRHPRAANAPNAPEARQALGWLHTARFFTTAAQLDQLPPMGVPEIAFVGRSNAGKSTAINTLTQQSQLAYASRRPGRTQHINLFTLGRQGGTDAVLADLPGYGYAAVPQADKVRWQRVMAHYLIERRNLAAVVMMADPRHGLTPLDDILLDLIRPRLAHGLALLVLLTKADKLTRAEQNKALAIVRLQTAGGDAMLFSALKRQGVDEAALWLQRVALTAAVSAPASATESAPESDAGTEAAGEEPSPSQP